MIIKRYSPAKPTALTDDPTAQEVAGWHSQTIEIQSPGLNVRISKDGNLLTGWLDWSGIWSWWKKNGYIVK